jgi:hypothetical protein
VGSHLPAPAAIEPAWVYSTPLHWKHAPRGSDESFGSVRVVVLYPDGQYFDAGLVLIRQNQSIQYSNGDGHLYRTGTWSRTDEHVIRIRSRVVYRDVQIVRSDGSPMPEPTDTDTCALEGRSATHLAAVIHCKRLILKPAKLNLDLSELQRMSVEASRVSQPK